MLGKWRYIPDWRCLLNAEVSSANSSSTDFTLHLAGFGLDLMTIGEGARRCNGGAPTVIGSVFSTIPQTSGFKIPSGLRLCGNCDSHPLFICLFSDMLAKGASLSSLELMVMEMRKSKRYGVRVGRTPVCTSQVSQNQGGQSHHNHVQKFVLLSVH